MLAPARLGISTAIPAALGLLLAVTAWGHPSIQAPIAELTNRIRLQPQAASLFLRRAQLYRLNREFSLAWQDLEICARLNPAEPGLDRSRAMVLLEIDDPSQALPLLDRAVASAPDDHEARLLRARAMAALNRPREALADLDDHLARSKSPSPDVYLERARLVLSMESTDNQEALAGLERGISRLGPALSLEQEAALMELRMGKIQAAQARARSISGQFERPGAWHAWQGELMERAGLQLEAQAEYTEALEEIKRQKPEDSRAGAQVSAIEDRLRRPARPQDSHVEGKGR